MDELQVKKTLDGMKKTRKTLHTLTLIAALAAIALLIVYNFMGVTFLQVKPSGDGLSSDHLIKSMADFTEGFTFPGWQMVFWGMGGQFIMQDHLFDPNPIAIVAMVGTILALIICTATYKAGKNKTKAVKEFICGGFLAFSALVLGFFIVPVASMAATDGSVYHFKSEVILAEGASFIPTAFAIAAGVILLIFAAVKIYNGCFLLKQRAFAQKYAPKKAPQAS